MDTNASRKIKFQNAFNFPKSYDYLCTVVRKRITGGNYVFTLFDNYSGNFPLLIVALFECIFISYVYGLKRFSDDIELMTGSRPNCYWLFCWKYVAPAAMVTILTCSFVKIATDGSSYEAWDKDTATTIRQEWPGWCHFVIAFLILVAAIWIPLVALLEALGIHLLPPEEPSWFPAEELRDYHALLPHKITDLEKCLFCMKEDEPEDMASRFCLFAYKKREKHLMSQEGGKLPPNTCGGIKAMLFGLVLLKECFLNVLWLYLKLFEASSDCQRHNSQKKRFSPGNVRTQ
ncbi:sodium- and chloride-dependent glycine transporter 2 [Caerostris extrusa]|uniref:Sodium- and chloride-dependent glycine transporter 2 n=1 Tax=Caerostris extrusa TaxID=172846 RepID=A0AAV4XG02_CAEEX|nr:sodium- and chloride-dependent glycine transporter 2 [Caerostris extrusa]